LSSRSFLSSPIEGGSVLRSLLIRYTSCRFLRREMLLGSFFNPLNVIISSLIFQRVWISANNPLKKSCLLGISPIRKDMEWFDVIC